MEPQPLRFTLPSGITIAADAYGDPEAPPLLFLHGGGQTRHAWGGTASALGAAGFLAITMDQRGHGESGWHPEGSYENADFRDDLLAVVEQLSRPPILIGASLGGIASLLAETHAAESICRAIVFVDVTPRLEASGVRRILNFMMARPEGYADLEEVAEAVAAYQPHRTRRKSTAGLEKNLRRGDDGRFYWHWDPQLLKQWDPQGWDPEDGKRRIADRLAAARRLRVPTMLVRGRMSDVVSEEGAREFLECVPHAEFIDLAGASHMVAGDRNDTFTDSVLDFVSRTLGS